MAQVFAIAVDHPGLAASLAARGLGFALRGDIPTPGDADDLLLMNNTATAVDARTGWPGPIAILMLAPSDASVIAALDAGADDVIDACETDVLVAARLAALARRRSPLLRVGPISIDAAAQRVTRDGQPVSLLPREFRLLRYLAERAGRPVGRQELLRQVWNLPFDPGTNVVEVHVSRLRARLDRGFVEPVLRTEKGRGYMLTA